MAAPTAQMAAPSDECFHGGYVLPDHPEPPPYELPQADPFVPDITSPLLSKRCAGNQDWADWRWVPSSRQCASGLRGRTYYEVCPQLRGRRLFYVGDSTQFEMFVSMGMLMGGQISLRPQERPLARCPLAVRLSQVPVQDRGRAKDVTVAGRCTFCAALTGGAICSTCRRARGEATPSESCAMAAQRCRGHAPTSCTSAG